MLWKFAILQERFVQQYGPTLSVREYYHAKRDVVMLENLERAAPKAATAFQHAVHAAIG